MTNESAPSTRLLAVEPSAESELRRLVRIGVVDVVSPKRVGITKHAKALVRAHREGLIAEDLPRDRYVLTDKGRAALGVKGPRPFSDLTDEELQHAIAEARPGQRFRCLVAEARKRGVRG